MDIRRSRPSYTEQSSFSTQPGMIIMIITGGIRIITIGGSLIIYICGHKSSTVDIFENVIGNSLGNHNYQLS